MTARRRPGAAFREGLVSLLDGCTQGGQLIGAALLPVRGPGVVTTHHHRAHLFADTSKRRLFGRIRPKSRRRCAAFWLYPFLAF